MKKLSLLVGTLGGAVAGYLFSNKKLRDELANAKDTEAAAKILGKHMQKDGKKVAKHIQEFVESEEVQENWKSAKEYAANKFDEATGELKKYAAQGTKSVKKAATKKKAAAKKAVKKVAKKTVAAAKKKVATAKKK